MISWRRLGEVPYSVALKGLKTAARALPGQPQIWARNSFVLGTLVPLVSDLDLTIWYASEPTADAIRALDRFLKAAKKAAPFLGEANVYVADEVEELTPLLNQFELARDPELSRRVSGRPCLALPLPIQAAAFLLRMLEADLKNLIKRPEERRRKWENHFAKAAEVCGIDFNPPYQGFPSRSALRGIADGISGLLANRKYVRDLSATADSLEALFECVARGVPWHVLKPLCEQNPLWAAAMPHRFLRVESTGDFETQLINAQLSWELWGVTSQYRLLLSNGSGEDLSQHLASIATMAREALGNRAGLVESADTLLARIKNRG